MDQWRANLKKHDVDLESARVLSRKFVTQIIVISSSAITFSVSLFSIDVIQNSIDFFVMKLAWLGFTITIIISFFSLFSEGRNEYARVYRAFQLMGNIAEHKLTMLERSQVIFVLFITWLYPTNLIFCKIYDSKEKSEHYSILNGYIVHYLARSRAIIFVLENLIVLFFIASIIAFIYSVAY